MFIIECSENMTNGRDTFENAHSFVRDTTDQMFITSLHTLLPVLFSLSRSGVDVYIDVCIICSAHLWYSSIAKYSSQILV